MKEENKAKKTLQVKIQNHRKLKKQKSEEPEKKRRKKRRKKKQKGRKMAKKLKMVYGMWVMIFRT